MVLAAVLTVLTTFPYFIGYAAHTPGRVFMGFFFQVDDVNTYLATIRDGASGSWTWVNRYTTEPVTGVYLSLLWLALGHLAALVRLSPVLAFQLLRVVGGCVLVYAAWLFMRRFVPDTRAQRFALVYLVLGLGLGFFVAITASSGAALDLVMPELSAFNSVLALPHYAWSAAFLAMGVLATFRGVEEGRFRWTLAAGAAWLGAALIHAQVLLPVFGALVVAMLWRRPPPRGVAAATLGFMAPLPYVAYTYYISGHDPAIARWLADANNGGFTSPVGLLLALAPQLVLLGFALPGVIRRRTREDVFLVGWVVLVAVLTWAPGPTASVRRRFFDGVYLPITALAARGMYEQLVPRLSQGLERKAAPVAWIMGSCLTTLYLLSIPLTSVQTPALSLSQSEVDGLSWLAEHPRGVVLASNRIGSYVPAYSPDVAYVGHYGETHQYDLKSAAAYLLLTGHGNLSGFDAANHVAYVFWTDEYGGAPPTALGPAAFAEPGVAIYDVRHIR